MKVIDERALFGEKITTPEEFITDLCERIDGAYRIVMEVESKTGQLACIVGFLRGFKGRLNRVCERSFDSKFSDGRVCELQIEGEETFFGEKINTSEEFIKDFRNRVDTVYATQLEEEHEIPRLAYLVAALIGLKGRLNRVCGTV